MHKCAACHKTGKPCTEPVVKKPDFIDKIVNFDGASVDYMSNPVTRHIKKRAPSTLIKNFEQKYRESCLPSFISEKCKMHYNPCDLRHRLHKNIQA